MFKDDAAFSQARDKLRECLLARQAEQAAELKELVKPVRHTIIIHPCQ